MVENDFIFNENTGNFLMCFNRECTTCSECLRYVVGQQISQKRTWGLTVFPNALHDGMCEYFQKAELVELAYGFHKLYAGVPKHLRSSLRHDITGFLGSVGSYYRYDKGERKLSPEQQEVIKGYMAEYGSQEERPFEHYEIGYYMKD
ncbi:MAG: DUF6078 family protein [Prevotella sp.]|nr:DUF6078 family protein [Prevotella sp.]